MVPGARWRIAGDTLATVSGTTLAALAQGKVAAAIAALRVGGIFACRIEHQAAKTGLHPRRSGIQPDFNEIVGKKVVEPERVNVGSSIEFEIRYRHAGVKTPLSVSATPDNDVVE